MFVLEVYRFLSEERLEIHFPLREEELSFSLSSSVFDGLATV